MPYIYICILQEKKALRFCSLCLNRSSLRTRREESKEDFQVIVIIKHKPFKNHIIQLFIFVFHFFNKWLDDYALLSEMTAMDQIIEANEYEGKLSFIYIFPTSFHF